MVPVKQSTFEVSGKEKKALKSQRNDQIYQQLA